MQVSIPAFFRRRRVAMTELTWKFDARRDFIEGKCISDPLLEYVEATKTEGVTCIERDKTCENPNADVQQTEQNI
jgi:hypothetical protein